MLRKLSKNAKITLSILFVFAGLVLITYTYFDGIKKNVYNDMNIRYIEQQIVLSEPLDEIIVNEKTTTQITTTVTTTTNKPGVTTTTKKKDARDSYIGYLEVPSVKIKRGFVSPTSKYNSVGYNVTIIKGSDMPDVKNGNFILAAHRGNSSVSYFDNLYKIKRREKAYITYNGKKYTYELTQRYEESKDGSLTIKRNPNVNTLTLITCTRNNKKTQTVFIFELVSID